MRIKRTITLIEILAVTGVVSVGFSSWALIETPTISTEGNFEVDAVYKHMDIKNMTFSDYDESGFFDDYVYSDSNTSKTGILEAELEVDLAACRSYFGTNLTFEVVLSQIVANVSSTYLLFTYASAGTVGFAHGLTYKYDSGSLVTPAQPTASIVSNAQNKIYTITSGFTIDISGNTSASILHVYLTYSFTFTDTTYNNTSTTAKDSFYEYVNGTGLTFSFDATIQGGN